MVTFLDTPGPRGVHRHARPRRQGHRHRGAGGGGRRRRDAADHRGDPACQGGRRADRRGGQQDRQARCGPGSRAHELSKHEVISEEWGGDNMFVHVSAKTGEGIDELLDAILLQAEVLELSRGRGRSWRGRGDRVQPGEGPRRGGHRAGQARHAEAAIRSSPARSSAACARCSTRPARPSRSAGPSMPVVVLGLSGTPNAGDERWSSSRRTQGARSGAVPPGQVPRRQAARGSSSQAGGRVLADGGRRRSASSSS